MPIYKGSGGVNMAAIYHGTTSIGRVYHGSTLVWEKPAAPGWSPMDMANIYAWFDADQQTEGNLGLISTLVDRTGNGRDFSGSGSTRPHLKTNILNGKPVIQLGEDTSGGNTITRMSRSGFMASETSGAMFYVFKARADPMSGGISDGAVFGGMENHSGDTHIPYTDGNCYTGFGSTTRRTFNPTPSLASWRIWHEHSASNDWAAWVDGTSVNSSGTNTVSFPNVGVSFGTGRADSTAAAFSGQCAEAVFLNAKPSSTDRQKLEGYFAHKWGLTANLPVGHPYISSPP